MEVECMPETALGRLRRLMQEAQKKVTDCEEKDRQAMAGVIGFARHRQDPCAALKKELHDLEDQYHRALANTDGIEADPLGNAIVAGLAGAAADVASLASDGIESLVGDEAAGGIAEGVPDEGGVEQPPTPAKEDTPEYIPDHIDTDIRPGGDPDALPEDQGGNVPNKPE
jgi:hypothetical protein